MQATASTFCITREDLAVDSSTLITEGLQIGSLPSCELNLNHPAVSSLHAGLKEVNGRFYIFNFASAKETMLNGRIIAAGEVEALADGDVVQIGPFSLRMQPLRGTLNIHVTLNFVLRPGEVSEITGPAQPEKYTENSTEVAHALEVYWQRRRREEGKIYTHSPLHPQRRTRLGKMQFNWMPTRDLIPVWPVAVITWAVIIVALISFVAALTFPAFFSSRHDGLGIGSYSAGDPLQRMLPSGLLLYGFGGALLFIIGIGIANSVWDSIKLRYLISESPPLREEDDDGRIKLTKEQFEKYDPDGPTYPHPVVIAERCIGCHACVDACPHDVLAIVNGIATPVARDQCMEDTSCQIECPVNPKACIVVNTTKKIPPRKAPLRDAHFETNVSGCYIIGDVSGQPLIKNAVNEGVDAMYEVAYGLDLKEPLEERTDYDVAIIGAGPAGLSAAMTAKQRGMKCVVLEQESLLSTIAAYPTGKYVFLKPDLMEMRGSLAVHESGIPREELLDLWLRAIRDIGLVINENESCKSIKKADDGDYFVVQTEKGWEKERVTYHARRVVLAIGNRGTPMRLKVPGEEIKVTRDGIYTDKVKYKLTDPSVYRCKKIIVVGAGNAAVEAAVGLVAHRYNEQIEFRSPEEINEVTLIVRSDLKNDLKFINKQRAYDCIDEGKIKVFFGTSIKEIREDEVVLQNARTEEVRATIPNDFIFAMIGGDRPTKFLESIGIKIG
jgi:thioredoxin reductase (NADPH)